MRNLSIALTYIAFQHYLYVCCLQMSRLATYPALAWGFFCVMTLGAFPFVIITLFEKPVKDKEPKEHK